MGMIDILHRYTDGKKPMPPPEIEDDFGEVAHEAGQDAIQDGIAEAFRADETPTFEEMVAVLFENSAPEVRAGLLDSLLAGLPPSGHFVRDKGVLSDIWRKYHAGARVAAQRAAEVDPADVEQVARQAREQNPGVLERVSRFYARHPEVVRNLGSVAMTVVLGRIARRVHH